VQGSKGQQDLETKSKQVQFKEERDGPAETQTSIGNLVEASSKPDSINSV